MLGQKKTWTIHSYCWLTLFFLFSRRKCLGKLSRQVMDDLSLSLSLSLCPKLKSVTFFSFCVFAKCLLPGVDDPSKKENRRTGGSIGPNIKRTRDLTETWLKTFVAVCLSVVWNLFFSSKIDRNENQLWIDRNQRQQELSYCIKKKILWSFFG